MSIDFEGPSNKMKLMNDETNREEKPKLVKDEIKPSPSFDKMDLEQVIRNPIDLSSTKPKTEVKDEKPKHDKAIQTEEYTWLQELVENIVVSRIKAYQKAAENSEHIDQKLSPILKRLKKENMELRESASLYKARLERIERIQSSQRKRLIPKTEPDATPSKRSMNVSTPTTSITEGTTIKPVHSSPLAPAQSIPMMSPVRSVYLQPQQPPPPPQQFYQLVPTSIPGLQQRVLIQPPYPCAKVPREGSFMIAENPGAPSYNMSTQVVVANQGLRMASIPNAKDNSRPQPPRPPMYSPPQNVLSMPRQPHPNAVARFQAGSTPTTNVNNANRNMWNNNQRQITIAPRKPHVTYQNHPPTTPINSNTPANKQPKQNNISPSNSGHAGNQPPSSNEARLALPFNPLPKIKASISASGNGIILTWDYEQPGENPDKYQVECYQLFAHQAKSNLHPRPRGPSDIRPWKKIGVVNALPLPMACTLTQFATGNVYYFAVVAVDIHGREGEMSNPCIIRLNLNQ